MAEGQGGKAVRIFDPEDIQTGFARAHRMMEEFSVPVVAEFALERVTNIPLVTDIDNINEFDQAIDLPNGVKKSEQAA